MKIAIVGGRKFSDYKQVEALLKTFSPDTIIVSGGAQGADALADKAAKALSLKTEIYLPDWNDTSKPGAVVKTNKFGKEYNALAGHWRNALIVESADLIYAFWDGKSPGTRNTINQARKLGKEVRIVSY